MAARTTLRLDPELLRQAKQLAAEEGISLSLLIKNSLRNLLHGPAPRNPHCRLPVSGEGGTLPGVDISDNSALLDRLDEYDPQFQR
jgi:hypothetical protein